MALLTKEERKNLDPEQRRELRRQRRAARPKKGFRININWDGLRKEAEALIVDLVGDEISGPEKMDEVLETLAQRADDWCDWPDSMGAIAVFFEAIDGPVVRALFGALVRPQIQKIYDGMKADGKL